MRKYLLLLTLIPLFSFGQVANNEKSITVIGISELEIEPDLITISMKVRETENVKKESDIVALESKFVSFLTSLGIEKDNFTIDRFVAREQSGTKFKQDKTYKLIINKASLLDTIVTKCFELGMENVYVSKIDHTQIENLRNELLSKALSSAKNKAEIIAKNMSITLGGVTLVNEIYKIVGERINSYDNAFYSLEEVTLTGYASGVSRSVRSGSTINLERLHLTKAVIVKYEIK